MGPLIGTADMIMGERKSNVFGKWQSFDDLEMEGSFVFFGRNGGYEGGGSSELITNDIIELLPSDPFGMNPSVTAFTAITDWLEDFEVESHFNLIGSRVMVIESKNGSAGIVGERDGNGFGKLLHMYDWEEDDYHGCFGRDSCNEGSGSDEPVSSDILDLLPPDPFDMDMSVATFNAIVDWLHDFEIESGWNLICNGGMMFELEDESVDVCETSNSGWRYYQLDSLEELGFMDVSCIGEAKSVRDVEEFMSFRDEDSSSVMIHQTQESGEQAESHSEGDGGEPHDGLLLSLGYLGLKDLLSAERVCRSLRSAVRDDPLLWKNIHIDQPLNDKITDDHLLRLTGRSQGILQSLSLPNCSRITDDGIKHVLECNPKLVKLSVPGCTRLSIRGLMDNLKAFQSTGMSGIKCLRIGGLYGVTQQHFEELSRLLNVDKYQQRDARKPQFFHNGNSLPSHDDDDDEWPIDVEMCPRCQKLRLVYDCPMQSCQGKQNATQQCRACIFCIARCVHCGRCINDSEYEETFCLDLLCWECWLIQCK